MSLNCVYLTLRIDFVWKYTQKDIGKKFLFYHNFYLISCTYDMIWYNYTHHIMSSVFIPMVRQNKKTHCLWRNIVSYLLHLGPSMVLEHTFFEKIYFYTKGRIIERRCAICWFTLKMAPKLDLSQREARSGESGASSMSSRWIQGLKSCLESFSHSFLRPKHRAESQVVQCPCGNWTDNYLGCWNSRGLAYCATSLASENRVCTGTKRLI